MRTRRKPYRHAQSGVSLVELMVAMVLGLLLTLAATAIYMGTRTNYSTIDDTTALDEKGRFALDTIVRIVRQSAWTNYAGNSAPATNPASGPIARGAWRDHADHRRGCSPTISGVDNCASPGQDASLNLSCLPGTTSPVNKSDVLQVRFFGSGTPSDRTVADNSMIDCSGNGVAEPQA
ncbi:PilW family protein [Cupriavidus basilensis]